MSDLTPPPDEPMPEQARARIRADLLAAAQTGRRPGPPRWVVPAVAAAAVVLVAGTTAWAVRVGGDDGSTGAPAGATSSTGETPAPTPLATASTDPSHESGGSPGKVGPGSCAADLEHVLPGADPVVAFPEDAGTTTFWVKGDRFVLCDVRDGVTTLHHPLPLDPVEQVETYRVGSAYAPAVRGGFSTRVAGGVVPAGAPAYDVSYTFPDGHTERSTTTMDPQGRTWWRMVYRYHDDGGNEMDLPPIHVVVSYSGVQYTYDLAWGTDTCAQANHGC